MFVEPGINNNLLMYMYYRLSHIKCVIKRNQHHSSRPAFCNMLFGCVYIGHLLCEHSRYQYHLDFNDSYW